MTSPSNTDLRDKLKAAHNLFHGRYNTHAEVAKHARWTPQELENVQIEDEEIYYDDILTLFQAREQKLITELLSHAVEGYPVLRATGKYKVVPVSVIEKYREEL